MKVKNLADQSLLLMIGRFASYILQIGATTILARILTKDNLGLYNQVILINNILVSFVAFGLDSSPYVFLPSLNLTKKKSFIIQTWLWQFLGGLIIFFAMFFGADILAGLFGNQDLSIYLRVLSLFPFFSSFSTSFYAILISFGKSFWAAGYLPLAALFHHVVVVVGILSGLSLKQVLFLISLLAGVNVILVVWIILAELDNVKFKFDWRLLRDQAEYSLPLYVGQTFVKNSSYIDQVIISLFFDTSTFAVYSIGTARLPFISLLARPIIDSIRSDISRYYAEHEYEKIRRLWHSAVQRNALMIFPIAGITLLLAEPVILLLYSDKYIESVLPFTIYLTSLPIRVIMAWAVLGSIGKTRSIAFGQISTVILSIPLQVILVNSIGWIGPAIGAVVIIYFGTIYYLFMVTKFLPIRFHNLLPWNYLFKTIIITVLSALVVFPLQHLDLVPLARMLISCVLFFSVYVLLGLQTGVITDQDKKHFSRWLGIVRNLF